MGADINTVGTIVSAVATAAGAAIASGAFKWVLEKRGDLRGWLRQLRSDDVFVSYRREETGKPYSEILSPPPAIMIAKRHLVTRLEEAEREKDSQESIERVNTWSANLLSFGQYVIGGVMASSFVQQSLTPNIIGLLGLLVLLSSIVKQHYHPDVRARIAGQKTARLQALIRDTEDRLVAIKAAGENEEDVKAVLALVTKLTSVLNELDAAHLPLPGEKALAAATAEKKAAKGR